MSMTRQEVIKQLEDMLEGRDSLDAMLVCVGGARDALKYLKECNIPETPSEEVLRAISDTRLEYPNYKLGNVKLYQAIRVAVLTPPKPKMKTVWYFTAMLHGQLRLFTHSSESEAITNREHPLR